MGNNSETGVEQVETHGLGAELSELQELVERLHNEVRALSEVLEPLKRDVRFEDPDEFKAPEGSPYLKAMIGLRFELFELKQKIYRLRCSLDISVGSASSAADGRSLQP